MRSESIKSSIRNKEIQCNAFRNRVVLTRTRRSWPRLTRALDRVTQELADSSTQVVRLEHQLASDFSHKAPAETVERERERLAEQRERQQTLERRSATLARLRDTSQ